MVKIDKRQRYFLAVMAVLLLAGIFYRFWPQLSDIRISDSDIAVKKKQLEKYRQLVQSGDPLEKEVVRLRETLKKAESGLLTGKTSALAAADIQKVVRETAEKCQVEIKTVRVLKAQAVNGSQYMSIPLQFSANCSVRQLKEFLYQMMHASKYLTVQKVAIRVGRFRAKRQKGSVRENVMADITVNGYLIN